MTNHDYMPNVLTCMTARLDDLNETWRDSTSASDMRQQLAHGRGDGDGLYPRLLRESSAVETLAPADEDEDCMAA